MLDTAPSTRRGNEFVGLARVFRNAVRAEDLAVDRVLAAIEAPLRERLRRHPRLRPETPLGVLRQWAETMPAAFRLGPAALARVRTEIAIAEARVTVSWLNDQAWNSDEHERGVGVCRLVFAVHKGRLIKRWEPIANVRLHALARWFERSGWRDHPALIVALSALADAPDEDDRVETPGGFWLGQVIDAMDDTAGKGCRMRSVRTWLAS